MCDAHRCFGENVAIFSVALLFDERLDGGVAAENVIAIDAHAVMLHRFFKCGGNSAFPIDQRAVAIERDDVVMHR